MDIRLPKLGEGSDSGTVVGILVKVGERISQGQVILELENEKAVAPIPATGSGTIIKIHVKEGDTVSSGQLLFSVDPGEGSAAAPAPPGSTRAEPAVERAEPEPEPIDTPAAEAGIDAAEPEAEVEAPPAPGKAGLAPPASPSIRKLARELGIDLNRIKGSEYGGRIVMKDLRAYIQKIQKVAFAAKPASAPSTAKPSPPKSIDFSQWGPISTKPLTALRNTISRRMSENWTTIPHVTQFDDADISGVLALRKKLAPAFEAKGARLTVTTFVLKALVSTLQKHPMFNSSLDEVAGALVYKQYYHIGLAVDTEAGLIVPVIRDVDKKNWVEVSKAVQDLAEKARDRKVSGEDLKGGTFTISNQGGIGGAHFTPIVNKPEVAILGLGRGALKPVARQQTIESRTLLPLCLSYDHRVIDGGSAARFMTDLVQALEAFKEADVDPGT
jgi:pyruvate dehydrogenase E2 component (dihydrolipoamide acetyltransferase)